MLNVSGTNIFSINGPGLLPSMSAAYIVNRSFPLPLADFTGDATLVVTMGGRVLPSTPSMPASISLLRPAAQTCTISAILKTPTIYADDSAVAVLYSVRDASGRAGCSPSGAAVSMTVGGVAGSCSMFSSAAPFGLCTATSMSPATSQQATVTLSASSGSPSSAVLPVALQRAPINALTAAQNATAGVYMQLPQHPLYPGDTITIAFSAQTAGRRLDAFSVFISFNGSALQYVSFSSPNFGSPTVRPHRNGPFPISPALKIIVSSSDETTGRRVRHPMAS